MMKRRRDSDEHYILDWCDTLLGLIGVRGKRFDCLRGDAEHGRKGTMLPVDIYYETLDLVVEYHERQHTESVPFMDKRFTVSGVDRGQQRRLYDQRRRDVLPRYGVTLVELHVDSFNHTKAKRLIRSMEDEIVIRHALSAYLCDQN